MLVPVLVPAVQPRPTRHTHSNSCFSIQLGEDLHSQEQLTYFLKPFPSAGQRVARNCGGGAVRTPTLVLATPELFSHPTFPILFATTLAAPTLHRVATET